MKMLSKGIQREMVLFLPIPKKETDPPCGGSASTILRLDQDRHSEKNAIYFFNFKNSLTKSRTFCLSMRKTPPVPAHFGFIPNDVTPATMLLSPRKLGPPESPKQVPPVLGLLDRSREKSPVNPGALIWIRNGYATMRTRSVSSFQSAAVGKLNWSP